MLFAELSRTACGLAPSISLFAYTLSHAKRFRGSHHSRVANNVLLAHGIGYANPRRLYLIGKTDKPARTVHSAIQVFSPGLMEILTSLEQPSEASSVQWGPIDPCVRAWKQVYPKRITTSGITSFRLHKLEMQSPWIRVGLQYLCHFYHLLSAGKHGSPVIGRRHPIKNYSLILIHYFK